MWRALSPKRFALETGRDRRDAHGKGLAGSPRSSRSSSSSFQAILAHGVPGAALTRVALCSWAAPRTALGTQGDGLDPRLGCGVYDQLRSAAVSAVSAISTVSTVAPFSSASGLDTRAACAAASPLPSGISPSPSINPSGS